jgi:hypothetical protein
MADLSDPEAKKYASVNLLIHNRHSRMINLGLNWNILKEETFYCPC